MRIEAIPAFQGNYIWLLRQGGDAVVVDPGAAAPVLHRLARDDLRLRGILITHHHDDHVGGVAGLLCHFPVPVFGPAGEDIPLLTRRLTDGERIRVLDGHAGFTVIEVPGHPLRLRPGVRGLHGPDARSLSRLASLPPATRVYCAHEYSLANARFALAAEPGNPRLQARRRWMEGRRQAGEPTVPSTLRDELDTNPFLRCRQPELRMAAAAFRGQRPEDGVDVFAALREWKNQF